MIYFGTDEIPVNSCMRKRLYYGHDSNVYYGQYVWSLIGLKSSTTVIQRETDKRPLPLATQMDSGVIPCLSVLTPSSRGET